MADESTLVQAARNGDRRAFSELVDRYARAIVARQYACTRELASAEDLAQETFLRAWQGLGRLDDNRSFGNWLLSIAGYVGSEWLRRKRTRDDHADRVAQEAQNAAAPRTEPDLPLAEAIARLDPEVQHLLALRHDRGLSCDEIASELGKPLGTVTKTLSRAYAELRERLTNK